MCCLSATRSWTTLRAVRSRTRRLLAVRAGAFGLGFSSTGGFIVFPLLSVQTLKHIGDRWALSLSVDWFGGWLERAPVTSTPYDDRLSLNSNRWSEVELRFRSDPSGHGANRRRRRWHARPDTRTACGRFAGGGRARGAWAFTGCCVPGAGSRWAIFPTVGGRYRPKILTPPPNPTGPVVIPPRVVHWVGATGQIAFFW